MELFLKPSRGPNCRKFSKVTVTDAVLKSSIHFSRCSNRSESISQVNRVLRFQKSFINLPKEKLAGTKLNLDKDFVLNVEKIYNNKFAVK